MGVRFVYLSYWYNTNCPELSKYELSDLCETVFLGTKDECLQFAKNNDMCVTEI